MRLRLALLVGVLKPPGFLGVAFAFGVAADGFGVLLARGVPVPLPADFFRAPMCSVMARGVG